MIISFFYRIREKMYHGKYIGYVSNDYDEGLDIEVLNMCYPIWKHAYSLQDESDVYVAIISYQRNGNDYFSENEKYVFDTLYYNWTTQPVEIFIEGKLWKKSNDLS
jgi:hypothetical protein